MRFTLRQEFPYPIKTVIAARELRYDDIENQPGLKSQELLGVEHDGPVVITRRLFRFGSAIPDVIKKLVPAGMLEMVDTNYFNTETNLSQFTMHSEYAPDKVKITATCPYVSLGENLTVREYEVHVHVSVPIVGNTVAKAILQSHKEALIKDHEIMLRACERLAQQGA
ncbi:MAG: DUF2505 domain-containing protein [Spirochaetota bacterium]